MLKKKLKFFSKEIFFLREHERILYNRGWSHFLKLTRYTHLQQQLPNLKLCSERSQLGYLVNLICDLSLSLSLSLFCQTLYVQGWSANPESSSSSSSNHSTCKQYPGWVGLRQIGPQKPKTLRVAYNVENTR